MSSYYRMIKPWDIIVTIGLISLSFIPIIIFSYQQIHAKGDITAVISSEGKVVQQITLTGHEGTDIIKIQRNHAPHQENVIEVRDGQIRIKHATCPDQICVQTGYVSKRGKTIICIPHQLVIELKGNDGQDDDLIISS